MFSLSSIDYTRTQLTLCYHGCFSLNKGLFKHPNVLLNIAHAQ